MVTAWHEGERKGLGISAADITGLHAYLYPIFKDASPDCLYGQIFTTFSHVTGRVTDWTAPGMDYYGLDGFQLTTDDTIDSHFGATQSEILAVSGCGPFAITEINSQLKPGRPAWFADAWQWAQDNDCLTFAIYYDAPGSGTPYEWDPSDTDTINTLSDINSAAAA